jgi:threonine dehydrogenase-like Zn-dependent dehydrogenase
VDDVPDGRGILFEVLRVGVDGTDKEINDAEYGDPPEGYDFLVTGHEFFGRVLEAGPNVQGLHNRRLRGGHRQTARYQHQVFVEVNAHV